MWKRFINWAFDQQQYTPIMTSTVSDFMGYTTEQVVEALARYCIYCKTSFKSKGACSSHILFKHKKDDRVEA